MYQIGYLTLNYYLIFYTKYKPKSFKLVPRYDK